MPPRGRPSRAARRACAGLVACALLVALGSRWRTRGRRLAREGVEWSAYDDPEVGLSARDGDDYVEARRARTSGNDAVVAVKSSPRARGESRSTGTTVEDAERVDESEDELELELDANAPPKPRDEDGEKERERERDVATDDDASDAANAGEEENFTLLNPPAARESTAAAAAANEKPEWMARMWRQSVDALDDAARSELDEKMREVPEELRALGVKAGDELFVTFGTASVKDFVFNWVAAARKINLGPIFVGALDDDMHRLCVEAGIPSMLLTGRSVLAARKEHFMTGGSESFKKMGTVKTKFIQDLLDLGLAPILSDADVVWMRDPRPLFNNGTYKYADVLISSDCIDTERDRRDDASCRIVNFNTGVVHFRPTEQAKEFVRKWKDKVASSTIAWMRDQPALNLLAREGNPPLSPAVSVPKAFHGQPGYRSIIFAANNTIRMGVLPLASFSNGHTFFVQEHHVHHPEDGAPYAVHMTYQYGDSSKYAYGKRERLRQHGLWYAEDEHGYWKSTKYLTISTKGAQARFDAPETIRPDDPEGYLTAIKRHFAEDKVRRVTIRNGLALAKALGRTFVFPPPRCYCDKIWNTLKGCRALGAETAHLPFACPMDHLYDLSGMFELDIDFREAGFLEDERLDARIREDVVRVQIGGANEDENSRETADKVLNRRFSARDAIEALDSFSNRSVIMFEHLDDGSFCGFGDAAEDKEFDQAANAALYHNQYYCFEEVYNKQGRPRSGRPDSGEYEPRVVERHCGKPEKEQFDSAERGVVSEILKDNVKCSCEFGFRLPTSLADTTCGAA